MSGHESQKAQKERDRPSASGATKQEAKPRTAERNRASRGAREVVCPGVYFILTKDERYVKIGFSHHIIRRLSQIKTIGPGTAGAKLLGYIPGTYETERWLHELFTEHRDSGEWFRWHPIIQDFAASSLAPLPPPPVPHLLRRTVVPAPVQKTSEHFTESEIKAFFNVIIDLRDQAIFTVLFYRGLKVGEVGALQLSDLDLENKRLFVSRSKGSHSFEYRITEPEIIALRAYLRIRGMMPGALFLSRHHRGIGRGQLHTLMHHYCVEAGIPRHKAHSQVWRRTIGHVLYSSGVDIVDIQQHLGHVSPQSTSKYIIATSLTKRDRVADQLDTYSSQHRSRT